jgi:hypothetical protein
MLRIPRFGCPVVADPSLPFTPQLTAPLTTRGFQPSVCGAICNTTLLSRTGLGSFPPAALKYLMKISFFSVLCSFPLPFLLTFFLRFLYVDIIF